MSTNRTINGVTYVIPSQGDDYLWGTGQAAWIGAVTNQGLFTQGGAFTLLSPVNFGPTNGLFAAYFASVASNPAGVGVIRLSFNDQVVWANSSNTGNVILVSNGTFVQASGGFDANTAKVINVANPSDPQDAVTYGIFAPVSSQAASAYAQANNAYTSANLAYAAANTAGAGGAANALLAYAQANLAYTTANAAANTVAVFNNGTLVLAAGNLNFNNSATINISSAANGTTQSNVAFIINTGCCYNSTICSSELAAYAQANAAYAAANAGSVGGANTQVQFNNTGAAGGSANLTFNLNGNVFTTSTLHTTAAANVATTLNVVTSIVTAGAVTAAGTITAATLNATSDKRRKKNIKRIKDSESIIAQLNGVRFDWKESNQPSVGLIAQEVEAVLPELVTTDEEGFKTLNYNGIIGVLIEEVKSLREEIKTLKAE